MNYTDESIIRALNDYKKTQYGTLGSGIYIKETLYEFAPVKLFEDRMSIMLPKKFVDMPLEMAKAKYPMEQRPRIIKMNEASDVNFAFSLLDASFSYDQIEGALNQFQSLIKAVFPSNVFYEKKVEDCGNRKVGWFDYKSHGMDTSIYNLMYVTPIQEKLMHGILNCPLDDVMIWKPIGYQVIKSIKDLTSVEEE